MTKRQNVAVVTGASSGIGYAVVQALAKDGHAVVAHGRREQRLRELGNGLPAYEYMAGDLTQKGACDNLLSLALTRFGHIDFVINCAGKNHIGAVEDIDVDAVSDMVRINVETAFRLTYLALKYFRGCGAGHLIHITSVMGYKVRETAGGYCGTKHAVEALCEALRMELAHTPIRISCLAPGLVQTELHRDLPVHPSVTRNVNPLNAAEVAEAVRWLMCQPPHIHIPQMVMLPKGHVI